MAKKRYRVRNYGPAPRLRYAADKKTLDTIDRAGGFRHLTPEQQEDCNIKTAHLGDFCDGMQPRHIKHFLAKGCIEEVANKTPRKAGK